MRSKQQSHANSVRRVARSADLLLPASIQARHSRRY